METFLPKRSKNHRTMNTSTPCVLVTGASSGIGYATAAYFLAQGWTVFGMSRSGITPDGVHPLKADITQPEAVQTALQYLLAHTHRLDAVVNAAGIGGAGALENFPLPEIQKIMDTNFYGSLHVLQATLPVMRAQGRGIFVVISSIAGLMGIPFHGTYCASKFAVEGLVESLRLELTGSGVHAVSICPGDTATPIIGHQYRAPEADVPAFYRTNFKKADDAMRNSVAVGISPDQVAATVFKVVSLPAPTVRYTVGDWLQRAAPTIKNWLPTRWFEAIMRKYYQM